MLLPLLQGICGAMVAGDHLVLSTKGIEAAVSDPTTWVAGKSQWLAG
jgi:hypothetical protein